MTPFRKGQASEEFSGGADLLYEILTDYDSYKEWMPQVGSSALLAEAGELAIASLDMTPGGEHISLECIHTTNRGVLSRVIEGDVSLKSFEWEIEQLDGDRCQVTLNIEGRFGDAAKTLAALQAYAAAFLPEFSIEGEKGEVTLEVFETETGLTCWFNGQEYEMKPVSKPK